MWRPANAAYESEATSACQCVCVCLFANVPVCVHRRITSLGSQLSALQAAAAVDKSAADKQLETMLARQAEKSLAKGREEAASAHKKELDELTERLHSRAAELATAREEAQELREQLEAAGGRACHPDE